MSLDLSIGIGDNAPALVWQMSFAVGGADFALVVTMPGGATETLTVSGGELTLDPVANTVSWDVTSTQSAALGYTNLYTLRQVAPQTQYRAAGRIFGVNGPVGPSQVTVTGDAAGPPPTTALDQSIGRGDNAPPLIWAIPFATTGSVFTLTVDMPGSAETVLSTADGSLVLDPVANTVTWPITSVQSAALAYSNEYALRRTSPETRYYAQGRIFGVDGPVRSSAIAVQVVGPQGPPGAIGATGPAGQTGPIGPVGGQPVYIAASAISGDKALMFSGPGTVVPADPTIQGYVYAGIATNGAQAGGSVTAITAGDIAASFWAWTPSLPVFVSPDGNLTQSPPASGRSHLIGWALDAVTIHLAPDPVIPIQ